MSDWSNHFLYKITPTLINRSMGLRDMPNYRRFTVPGAAVFFTVVTYQRRRFLIDPLARRCLRMAFRKVRATFPFEVAAIVLLPDHLHAIWILPPGDHDYSLRWRRIKEEFTRRYLAEGGQEVIQSASRDIRGQRRVWQRRFWEHTIQVKDDFENHCDYMHYNPVKHGLVECPMDWPYSSFHRWVNRGVYPRDRACSEHQQVNIAILDEIGME